MRSAMDVDGSNISIRIFEEASKSTQQISRDLYEAI